MDVCKRCVTKWTTDALQCFITTLDLMRIERIATLEKRIASLERECAYLRKEVFCTIEDIVTHDDMLFCLTGVGKSNYVPGFVKENKKEAHEDAKASGSTDWCIGYPGHCRRLASSRSIRWPVYILFVSLELQIILYRSSLFSMALFVIWLDMVAFSYNYLSSVPSKTSDIVSLKASRARLAISIR